MEMITQYAPYASLLVPVLVGILEVCKKNKFLAEHINLLGIVFGVALAFLGDNAFGLNMNYSLLLLAGVMLGLSATGLYEFGSSFGKKKE